MVPVLRASSRVGAGHDLFFYTLGSILRDVFHIFVLHILIGQRKENRFSRSCPDREPVSGFCLCRGTGEDRKIGLRVADGLVIKRCRFFFYDQPDQDVPVIRHFCVLSQRNDPAFVKLHIAVHRQKHRQHVGKSVSSVNTSSDRREIPELDADDVTQRRPYTR